MDNVRPQTIVIQRQNLPKILSAIIIAALIITGVAFWLLAIWQPEVAQRDEPVLIPPAPNVDPEHIIAVLPQDSIPAIDNPQYATVADAEAFMDPDEQVIGLVINGDARAFPLPILSSHEIVNDIIGGEAVAVTWCPLCYSALVFSREIDGWAEPLSFGVSGKLLRETLVMYDRQTESLWSQLYGAAIEGSMTGARLAFFPSVLTEWQSWRVEQPETLVLSKPATCAQFNCGTYASNPRGSYEVDAYASYYNSADEGVVNRNLPRGESRTSGRSKERVLGLRLGGVERAYPFEILKNQALVNDTLRDEPVLIWFDPGTSTGTAYLRRIDEQTLVFALAPGEPGVLRDEETGSRWLAISGEAVEGPLSGRRLPALVATPAFAFSWFGYFPGSEVFGGD